MYHRTNLTGAGGLNEQCDEDDGDEQLQSLDLDDQLFALLTHVPDFVYRRLIRPQTTAGKSLGSKIGLATSESDGPRPGAGLGQNFGMDQTKRSVAKVWNENQRKTR